MSDNKSSSSNSIDSKSPSRFWGNFYIIVLLSGFSFMGIEIAGVRLVEPHFGSTIYVWGSIIGIFMAALSLGYWAGGVLSDKKPKIALLGLILLLSSLFTVIIPPISPYLCQWLNSFHNIDVKYRTLVASLILFAPSSIFMGMVSPFAIRLAAKQVSKVGSLAGSLYALSTVGSILGTFLVSFILVELIGSAAIVYSFGVVLALISFYCFLSSDVSYKHLTILPVILILVLGYFGSKTPLVTFQYGEDLLDVKESAYHYITIVNGPSQIPPYKTLARLMLFNNQVESGIEIDRATKNIWPGPAQTACGYVNLLHLGMVITGKAPTKILVIGCGGGVGPRMFKEYYPNSVQQIDVLDIDPWVFKLAETWFDYPFTKDQVIKSHVADGRLFVEQLPQTEKWDYIILDAYSSGGKIPRHLITEEFFSLLQSHLTTDGVLVANIISAFKKPYQGLDNSRLYRSVYKTISKVFNTEDISGGNIYVFPRNRSGENLENIILVANQAGQPHFNSNDIRNNFNRIRSSLLAHLDLDKVIGNQLTTRPELSDISVLTDDFCPTDTMTHR